MNIWQQILLYFQSISFRNNPLAILDIALVALIIYWVFARIKGTRAFRILWGLLILVIIYLFANIFHLNALTWIMRGAFTVAVVAIPVVFQPELRRLLENIGKNRFWRSILRREPNTEDKALREIENAVKAMAKSKTGALIALKQNDSLAEYEETGIQVQSEISNELLRTIFFPKSPLHDGAVIIVDNKISCAGATLPLADKEKSFHFGTRHRAAIGLAKETDAQVIIVSEERGTISLAVGDELIEEIPASELSDLIKKHSKR